MAVALEEWVTGKFWVDVDFKDTNDFDGVVAVDGVVLFGSTPYLIMRGVVTRVIDLKPASDAISAGYFFLDEEAARNYITDKAETE